MRRIGTRETMLLIRRLAMLIRAGTPLVASLTMLSAQASSTFTREVLTEVARHVEQGGSLASGLQKYPRSFSLFAVNVIRIGEGSGSLDDNLEYLAKELQKRAELKRTLISAFVYPAVICVGTIGITIVLAGYVFPKIIPIFQSFHAPLPWTTRTLIAISTLVRYHSVMLLMVVASFIVSAMLLLRLSRVRRFLGRAMLSFPLLGNLIRSYYLALSSRTLSLLLSRDMSILEAIQLLVATTSYPTYCEQFSLMTIVLARGETMAEVMRGAPHLFPPMVSQLVAVGESTGHLAEALSNVATMCEDDLRVLTSNLATLIEPLLMVCMGLIVGFIAISIITPMYGITQHLGT